MPTHHDRHHSPYGRQRTPPPSPLFPYTTLFRSRAPASRGGRPDFPRVHERRHRPDDHRGHGRVARAEEHTSELQSPYDLVCRLLHVNTNGRNTLMSVTLPLPLIDLNALTTKLQT